MELAHRWRDRNLTRMELIMALLVLALLIGYFSRYTLVLFARAEKTMMNRTVMNINTTLNYHSSYAALNRQYDALQSLSRINPMESVQLSLEINQFDSEINTSALAYAPTSYSPPANYGGVIFSGIPEVMEKGKWYFQQDDRILVYRLSNDEFFNSDLEGPSRIRFRIKLDYKDNNANGQYEANIDEYNSIKLESVDRYTWEI